MCEAFTCGSVKEKEKPEESASEAEYVNIHRDRELNSLSLNNR